MGIIGRTEYILMSESTTDFDETGIARADLFTYPFNNFANEFPLQTYVLTETDVYRFDLFILETYGEVNFYLKFVLWYNNINILDEEHIGVKILVPNKRDLDNFFSENLK